MHLDDEHDPHSQTYVLDETVTTKAMTIAELAEMAARDIAPRETERDLRTTENAEKSPPPGRTVDRR